MPVGYTDIVGKFTRAVVDGPDSDREPDRIPIEGLEFEFVVDLKPAIARDTVAKETVYLEPIPATTDANGVLIGPDGLPGIRLTASDSPDLEPNGWTYTVTTKGAGLPTVKTTFVTESGKTLDFSDIVAVPPNPGNQIPAWTAVVSQATTAAAEANEAKTVAVAAAESVQRDQPNGVAPLGADAKIPDAKLPARLADSALTAKIGESTAGKLDSATAAALYATKGAVTRPAARIRPHNKLRLTAGGGSFTGQAAASALADSSAFVAGSSSAKLVTQGKGVSGYYAFPGPLAWDLTASTPRLWIRVSAQPAGSYIIVDLSDTNTFNNRFRMGIGESSTGQTNRILRDGEWVALDLPRGEFTTDAGTPSWANINYARIIVNDANQGAMTVNVNGIAAVPDVASKLVALTADDSFASHKSILFPMLDAYGIPCTLFPILSKQAELSYADMRARRDMFGWEIGMHSFDAADHNAGFPGLTAAQARAKFDSVKTALGANGLGTDMFAWPLGTSDATTETVAREYASLALGTRAGTQPTGFTNPMRVRRLDVGSGKTLATLTAAYDKAVASKGVLVPMIHNIVATSPTGLAVQTSVLQAFIDYMVADGATFVTVSGAARAAGVI